MPRKDDPPFAKNGSTEQQAMYYHSYGSQKAASDACLLQAGMNVIFLPLTFLVWWAAAFGFTCAVLGLIAVREPIVRPKWLFIRIYFYSNYAVVFAQVAAVLVMMEAANSSPWNDSIWRWVFVCGELFAFVVVFVCSISAMDKTKKLLSEMQESPPPKGVEVYLQPLIAEPSRP